jgi:predicted O-methyltransferase YrrM
MRAGTPEEKYINDVFGLHDPELLAVKRELEAHEVGFMSISGHEARLLQFLIRAFQVKKIVEVGTLFGYSAIAMAKALPADGRLITLEKNPVNFEISQNCIRRTSVAHKIEGLCGGGEELLHGIESKGPFDMVFIDANKGGYVTYLNWAEKHVRPGGLIVGDNTFLFGALWGQSRDRDVGPNQIKVMSEFNTRLADPSKYNSILIPTSEGMTIAQKR